MRYIQRDKDGNLVGHFANEQPYAQELVADDHPDIVAFTLSKTTPKQYTASERVDFNLRDNTALRALLRVLAQRFNLTEQQIIDAIKTRAD